MGEDGTCWGQGEARARPQSNEGMVGLLNVPRFPLFWITPVIDTPHILPHNHPRDCTKTQARSSVDKTSRVSPCRPSQAGVAEGQTAAMLCERAPSVRCRGFVVG